MTSMDELVQSARDILADHITANSPNHDGHWIRFFIELAIPVPHQSTICRHPLCGEKTKYYRISVHPDNISVQENSIFVAGRVASNRHNMIYFTRSRTPPTHYYHPSCFDELIDLTKPTYIDAFQPLTPMMCTTSFASETSILDWGAYRLVQEWKVQVKRIARPELSISVWLNPRRVDLWYNGGSARYRFPGRNTNPVLCASFSTVEAAVESDGWDEGDEWSFFNRYFPLSLGGGCRGAQVFLCWGRCWRGGIGIECVTNTVYI